MNTFILQNWRLFVNVLSYFSCPPALLPPGDLSQAPKREAGAPGGRRFTGAGQRPAPCKTKAGAEGPCFVGAMRPRRPPAERPAPRQPYGEPPEKRAARLYLPYKIASAPYRAAIPARHTRCRNRAQRFSSTSGWNWTPSTSGPASTPSMVPSRVAAHWIRPGAKPLTR